ncbi:hypothetical protein PT974_02054 [Cladobotryum mycophilum]|uniref:Uncharacterized protein n=1 Tax=Cladobotryum mycophilum TaxID=491253 RepID=A0ABR0SXC6_9HYPO
MSWIWTLRLHHDNACWQEKSPIAGCYTSAEQDAFVSTNVSASVALSIAQLARLSSLLKVRFLRNLTN